MSSKALPSLQDRIEYRCRQELTSEFWSRVAEARSWCCNSVALTLQGGEVQIVQSAAIWEAFRERYVADRMEHRVSDAIAKILKSLNEKEKPHGQGD